MALGGVRPSDTGKVRPSGTVNVRPNETFFSLFKLCTYRLFLGNTYVFFDRSICAYSAVNKCRPVCSL